MLLKISGYSISKRPWAALENELYFRGIMLAVREWVHVSAGNGLWEMPQWNGEKGEARRKKRSGRDLSATTHHLLKSRSGPCVVPWYFCLAFYKETARKFMPMCGAGPGALADWVIGLLIHPSPAKRFHLTKPRLHTKQGQNKSKLIPC